jgi:hypothetical protein
MTFEVQWRSAAGISTSTWHLTSLLNPMTILLISSNNPEKYGKIS